MKLSELKQNPNNPRIIKDDKFKRLVQSITEFPQMLELRPIVVNSDMISNNSLKDRLTDKGSFRVHAHC